MTPRQYKSFVKFMKANGITHFKDGDLEIKLSDNTEKPKKPISKDTDPELLKNDVDAMMPSDGDLLFWSSSTYEELVEGRKGPAVNEEK